MRNGLWNFILSAGSTGAETDRVGRGVLASQVGVTADRRLLRGANALDPADSDPAFYLSLAVEQEGRQKTRGDVGSLLIVPLRTPRGARLSRGACAVFARVRHCLLLPASRPSLAERGILPPRITAEADRAR